MRCDFLPSGTLCCRIGVGQRLVHHAALPGVGCLDRANELRNVADKWETLPLRFVSNREVRVTGDGGLNFDEVNAGLLQIIHRASRCVRVIRWIRGASHQPGQDTRVLQRDL